LTKQKTTITEDDLHAYVDGMLGVGRRLAVALYLVSAPADAARVEAFRAQKEAVHALFGAVVDEPLPRRLKYALRLRRHERVLRRCLTVAAAVGLAGLILLAGGVLAQRLLPNRPPIGAKTAPDTQGIAHPVTRPARRHGLDL
jgi:anti-sigma factor RsiW